MKTNRKKFAVALFLKKISLCFETDRSLHKRLREIIFPNSFRFVKFKCNHTYVCIHRYTNIRAYTYVYLYHWFSQLICRIIQNVHAFNCIRSVIRTLENRTVSAEHISIRTYVYIQVFFYILFQITMSLT